MSTPRPGVLLLGGVAGATVGIGLTLWAMWMSGDPASAATQQWGTALSFVAGSAGYLFGAWVAARLERRR